MLIFWRLNRLKRCLNRFFARLASISVWCLYFASDAGSIIFADSPPPCCFFHSHLIQCIITISHSLSLPNRFLILAHGRCFLKHRPWKIIIHTIIHKVSGQGVPKIIPLNKIKADLAYESNYSILLDLYHDHNRIYCRHPVDCGVWRAEKSKESAGTSLQGRDGHDPGLKSLFCKKGLFVHKENNGDSWFCDSALP